MIARERRFVLRERRAPREHRGIVVEREAHRRAQIQRRLRGRGLRGRAENSHRGERGADHDEAHGQPLRDPPQAAKHAVKSSMTIAAVHAAGGAMRPTRIIPSASSAVAQR